MTLTLAFNIAVGGWGLSTQSLLQEAVCLMSFVRDCNFQNSRNFHRSFENEVAPYSSNFGDKYQILVEIDKECGFPLNFDMPWPFSPRKTELQPIKSPNVLLYPRVEEQQRTHWARD